MFKKIKTMLSYEYAVKNRRNFIKNRLLALVFDILQVVIVIALALIAAKLSTLFVGV